MNNFTKCNKCLNKKICKSCFKEYIIEQENIKELLRFKENTEEHFSDFKIKESLKNIKINPLYKFNEYLDNIDDSLDEIEMSIFEQDHQ